MINHQNAYLSFSSPLVSEATFDETTGKERGKFPSDGTGTGGSTASGGIADVPATMKMGAWHVGWERFFGKKFDTMSTQWRSPPILKTQIAKLLNYGNPTGSDRDYGLMARGHNQRDTR